MNVENKVIRMIPAHWSGCRAGLAGHVGVAHVYSHSGFMQDDSLGFATMLEILTQAHPMNLRIAEVRCDDGEHISVRTADGGTGTAWARRGVSPFELDMMQRAVDLPVPTAQHITSQIFGRVYGQGVSDTAAAFELALCRAQMDTVRRCWPEPTLYDDDDTPESCGSFLGGGMLIDEEPVSWLLTINASEGVTGPNEDSEGIIPIGNKGRLMKNMGADTQPFITIEAKSFAPDLISPHEESSIFVRWNKEWDNPVVARVLSEAAEEHSMPNRTDDTAYPRSEKLQKDSEVTGSIIAELGGRYRDARSSAEKVAATAQLALVVSEHIGGSIFMTDAIFRMAGGGGLWPGQSAMISLISTEAFAKKMKTMVATGDEVKNLADVTLHGMKKLLKNIEEARYWITERRPNLTPEQLHELAAGRA